MQFQWRPQISGRKVFKLYKWTEEKQSYLGQKRKLADTKCKEHN